MFAVDASLTCNPIDLNQETLVPFGDKPELLLCEASQGEVTIVFIGGTIPVQYRMLDLLLAMVIQYIKSVSPVRALIDSLMYRFAYQENRRIDSNHDSTGGESILS